MTTPLTPAQFQNFDWWRQHITIDNYDGNPPIIPYEPRMAQKLVAERLVAADREQRPFRIVVLKARRLGLSTFFQARFVHRASTRNHFKSLTVAQDHEQAAYLFEMSEGIWDRLPKALQVPKERGNQGRLMFLQNGSSMRTASAKGETLGRGKGNFAIHASEVAWWPDAQKAMTGLKATVPRKPGTMFIEESTANGVGNYFWHAYQDAKEGKGGYEAIFFPWFLFPDYTLGGGKLAVKILDEREEALVEKYGVSLDQLWWRRQTIDSDFKGDERLFDQEYPEDDEVAFLTSGRPFFRGKERCKPVEPVWVGNLKGDPVRGGTVAAERDSHGCVQIWGRPDRDERYAVFLDVAGQATGREYQARDAGDREDYSAGYVISLDTGRLVAGLHGRWDHDELALEVARLGRLYNTATIAVERTGGYGGSVLLELNKHLAYPRLYRDRNYTSYGREELGNLGWNTTLLTRPMMLDALRSVVRDHPDRIVDRRLLKEMTTFVVRNNAKAQAEVGAHDDCVMAAAGAYAIFNELAMTSIDLRKRVTPKRQVSLQSRAPRSVA